MPSIFFFFFQSEWLNLLCKTCLTSILVLTAITNTVGVLISVYALSRFLLRLKAYFVTLFLLASGKQDHHTRHQQG